MEHCQGHVADGAFIRTSRGPVPLPAGSAAAQEQFTPEVRTGVDHPTGVWFNERARELTFRSEKYDAAYTLLHLGAAAWDEGRTIEDTYERFMRR
jgi:hypothetical protein